VLFPDIWTLPRFQSTYSLSLCSASVLPSDTLTLTYIYIYGIKRGRLSNMPIAVAEGRRSAAVWSLGSRVRIPLRALNTRFKSCYRLNRRPKSCYWLNWKLTSCYWLNRRFKSCYWLNRSLCYWLNSSFMSCYLLNRMLKFCPCRKQLNSSASNNSQDTNFLQL
jgi:hypothetical protein